MRQKLWGRLDWSIIGGAWLLFAIFFVVEPIYFATSRQSLTLYEGRSIFLSSLTGSLPFLFGYLGTVLLLFVSPRLWWHKLPRVERLLQLPIIAIVLALTWHLATLEYNFYLERTFAADRIVLIVLGVLAMLHPAFVSAFIVSAHAFTAQLNVPPMFFSWTDTRVLYQMMVALVVYFGVRGIRNHAFTMRLNARLRDEDFLRPKAASGWALLLGVLGSWYFISAVGKLELGWLWRNDLSLIVAAAYQQHGWLTAWISAENHAALVDFVDLFAVPMQLGALLAESLVILHFASRRFSIFIFLFCTSLHLMIFGTTGILFWKWMLVNFSLVLAFLWLGETRFRQTFPRWTMLLACAAIIVVHAAFSPRITKLAWYDSAFVYRFRFEGVGESGTRYEIIPDTFAPWDSRFAQSRWFFVTDVPRLVDVFGSTHSRAVFEELGSAETPEEVNAIVDEHGWRLQNDEQAAAFGIFLQQFMEMTEWRESAEPVIDFYDLAAPHHIWTYQRFDAPLPQYAFQEPLVEIEMDLTQRNFMQDQFVIVSHYDAIYRIEDE